MGPGVGEDSPFRDCNVIGGDLGQETKHEYIDKTSIRFASMSVLTVGGFVGPAVGAGSPFADCDVIGGEQNVSI